MEEKIKYGFWDQIPIAFFQPEKYKEFLPVKRKWIAGFVLLIVGLAFIMQYILPMAAWDISVGGMENLMTNGIPSFHMADGVLEMERPIDMNLAQSIHLVVDTSKDSFATKDISGDYPEEFLLSKNNLVVSHSSMTQEIKFADHKDIKIDNAYLVGLIPYIKTYMGMTLFMLLGTKICGYLLGAVFFGFLCRGAARTMEGRVVTMKVAIVCAIYGRALFMLLETLNACFGFFLNSTYMIIIAAFFSVRYIIRAERSILGIERRNVQNKGDE